MDHNERNNGKKLDDAITVGNAVKAVVRDAAEAELFGDELPVERIRRSGESAAPERRDRRPLLPVGKAVEIAKDHLGIGEKMMPHRDRLRALKVSVARHDEIRRLFRPFGDHAEKVKERRSELFALVKKKESKIERDLVVSAPAGVKPLSGVARASCELALNEGVDVLGVHVDLQRAAFKLREDLFKRGNDLFAFAFVDYSLPPEHFRVSDRAADVLRRHPAVKGDRRVEIVRLFVKLFLESSCPEGHDELLLSRFSPL